MVIERTAPRDARRLIGICGPLAVLIVTGVLDHDAWGGSIADLDKKHGFRDAVLGSPYKSLSGLTRSSDDEDRTCYARSSDSMKMGDAQLATIEYCFFNDKLEAVKITANGVLNGMKILDVLESAYGHGVGTQQLRLWSGKRVKLAFASSMNIVLVTLESPEGDSRRRHKTASAAKRDL